jgi:hypothetical protein
MKAIIIQPKDQDELNFFLELAKRLGVKVKTYEDVEDERLLRVMEDNRKTQRVGKKNIIETLHNILNDDQAAYKA